LTRVEDLVYLFLKTLVFWFLVVGSLYTCYFTTGVISAEGDPEVELYQSHFRLHCAQVTKGDKNCWNRIEFGWKNSWEPPLWLWKSGFITPFLGVAPFYLFPISVQPVLLEPRYWNGMSSRNRCQIVWHEMGHAALGWDHSSNPKSLMTPISMVGGSLVDALVVAYEENK